jgi:hypothetical protein
MAASASTHIFLTTPASVKSFPIAKHMGGLKLFHEEVTIEMDSNVV